MGEHPTDRARVAEQVLRDAAELPADQRATHIEKSCGNDQELKAVVDFLLADSQPDARNDPPGEADEPVMQEAARDSLQISAADFSPLKHIGRYKLLQLMGEGGFGSVYMAEQEHPIRRRVAIKVIKPGMDSRQISARFEAERQALAMMDHPNIARVLDAGTTERDRPYVVMELVKGIPITEYCETHHLSIRERLELCVLVCNAVQHAHQKGIIHRDLKPNNVLVTLNDGKPVPKVIDFGIAKAIHTQLTDRTLFTEHRQLMGTPQYMSPEQAEMTGLDIDTRSDIYSLGALLYRLLTRTTPFDDQELDSKALADIQRIIREIDPPRPSTRLATLAEKPADASGKTPGQIMDARRLSAQLKGELDWIVMKCLEKDRTRRYETASALAADIRHYLDGDPVLARPATAAYRARKFIGRHKVGVLAASAMLTTLVIGLAIAWFGMVRAQRERVNALLSEKVAEAAKQEAVDAIQVLRDVMQIESRPGALPPRMRDTIQRLDEGWLADLPETAATLRSVMGIKFARNSDTAAAKQQFTKAVELLPPREGLYPAAAADALAQLASLLMEEGDVAAGQSRIQDALNAIGADPTPLRDPFAVFPQLKFAIARLKESDREAGRKFAVAAAQAEIKVHTIAITGNGVTEVAFAARGPLQAQLGLFEPASEDLKRLLELNPAQARPRMLLGYLELYLNPQSDSAYRQQCQALLNDLESTGGMERLEMVRLCMISPNPMGRPAEMRNAIDNAAPGNAWTPELRVKYDLVRAMIRYRAPDPGRFADAFRAIGPQLGQGAVPDDDKPTAELIMAMCQYQLGDQQDARRLYNLATRDATQIWAPPGTDVIPSVPHYLAYQILKREAESLMPSIATTQTAN